MDWSYGIGKQAECLSEVMKEKQTSVERKNYNCHLEAEAWQNCFVLKSFSS